MGAVHRDRVEVAPAFGGCHDFQRSQFVWTDGGGAAVATTVAVVAVVVSAATAAALAW